MDTHFSLIKILMYVKLVTHSKFFKSDEPSSYFMPDCNFCILKFHSDAYQLLIHYQIFEYAKKYWLVQLRFVISPVLFDEGLK